MQVLNAIEDADAQVTDLGNPFIPGKRRVLKAGGSCGPRKWWQGQSKQISKEKYSRERA